MRPITIALTMSLFGAILFGAGFFLGRQTTEIDPSGFSENSSSDLQENNQGSYSSSKHLTRSNGRHSNGDERTQDREYR